MQLCTRCVWNGYCKKTKSKLVSDNELADPVFILGVRRTANELNIPCSQWLDALYDMYRDYPGCVIDGANREIFLDLEVFEQAPSIREWFRDWACRPAKANSRVRVRGESRERIRLLATILRACFPDRTLMWGIVAVNDNDPLSDDEP